MDSRAVIAGRDDPETCTGWSFYHNIYDHSDNDLYLELWSHNPDVPLDFMITPNSAVLNIPTKIFETMVEAWLRANGRNEEAAKLFKEIARSSD